MAFTCQICFDEKHERFALPKLQTGNGDVLRNQDCQHPICSTCLGSFVTARVEQQLVFHVRCPFIGCANELFEQDISRLASGGALSKDISERFADLRARDYTAHAESLREIWSSPANDCDYEFILKLWTTTRLCPRCSLVIEKSEGCNSFYCVCGHHFNFQSAPRVVGGGNQRFGDVVDMARAHTLPLAEVQEYGDRGDSWSKRRAFAAYTEVLRIMTETRLSREESWKLLKQARLGDAVAREKIRLARNRGETTAVNEKDEQDEEEQEFGFDLWENSTEEVESVDILDESQDGSNVTIAIDVLDQVTLEDFATRVDAGDDGSNSGQKWKAFAAFYIKATCPQSFQVKNESL